MHTVLIELQSMVTCTFRDGCFQLFSSRVIGVIAHKNLGLGDIGIDSGTGMRLGKSERFKRCIDFSVLKLNDAQATIRKELSKVIIGQQEVVEQTLIAIFTRSHALLVGVPGLAKTLTVRLLARCIDTGFPRI